MREELAALPEVRCMPHACALSLDLRRSRPIRLDSRDVRCIPVAPSLPLLWPPWARRARASTGRPQSSSERTGALNCTLVTLREIAFC